MSYKKKPQAKRRRKPNVRTCTTRKSFLPAIFPNLKEVRIRRAEGSSSDKNVGKWLTFKSIAAANAQLTKNAKTAPKGGGADKTDFVLVWTDGTEYTGTYMVRHGAKGDIRKHVKDFAAGTHILRQMEDETGHDIPDEELRKVDYLAKLVQKS